MTFAFQWLQPLDEPTCVLRRVVIFWSLEHEQNWASGVSVYQHRRCETHSRIRSNILLQAANISGTNWKHTCLGKPTHQPLRTIEEWTYLLYLFTQKPRIEPVLSLCLQSFREVTPWILSLGCLKVLTPAVSWSQMWWVIGGIDLQGRLRSSWLRMVWADLDIHNHYIFQFFLYLTNDNKHDWRLVLNLVLSWNSIVQ